MTKVEKLKLEVKKLNRTELTAFREWFRSYDADEWDRQIEADIGAGKLDKLSAEALAAHKAGRTKEL